MRHRLPVRPLRRALVRLASDRGFTLSEALATMAILGIVIGGLTNVFVSASRAELELNRRVQAQQHARLALDKLRREIHCANAVTDTSAGSLTPGSQYSAISVTLGGYCPTVTDVASSSSTTVYVTWCTVASSPTGDYALYRLTSTSSRPACSSSGTKYADYLTTSSPFCLPSKTAVSCTDQVKQPTNALPMMHLDVPVNIQGPASSIATYKLVDDIALRNGTRS
jgi:prepilin-type N-terminal cleavage/methylation domain-containing protein